MVLTTKQTKASAPAAPSRSSSSTVTPKAAKRASLVVKPATSIPSPTLKETYTDKTGGNIPPEARNPSSQVMANAKPDPVGPFADNAKFLPSPRKSAVAKKPKAKVAKRPSKVHKRRKSTTQQLSDLITLLTKISFLLFSIYSLLVCPKDVQMESPVCRGLDRYRRTIVDPYILPPLRAVVTHPAIAPHIERAKPYVDQTVEVVRTQYNIVHDKVIVATDPYMVLARKHYNAKVHPQVRLMQYNMRRYQRQAQPYVNVVKAKALQAWYRAEVYALPILSKLEQAPIFIKNFIAKPLEEGKERWVDPQLKKIVDKVHEMSANANVVAEEKSASVDGAITSAAKNSAVSSDGTSATTEQATFYSSPSVPAATAVSITETTSTSVNEEPPAASVPEPAPEESAQTGIPEAPPNPATLTSEVPSSESSTTTTATETSGSEPSESTIDPLDVPLIAQNYDELVEDIEFFEDLEEWVSKALAIEETQTSEMPPKPTRLTAEEKAEKKRIQAEETAAKRKDILARHDKWEEQFEALIAAKTSELQEFLEKNRKQVANELSSSSSAIQSQLSTLKNQLNLAIKNTKHNLKQMEADWEDRYREMDEDALDKLPRWAGILENLEFSFTGKKDKISQALAEWVAAWMQTESAMVKAATDEVQALADKAQKDLIEDYAWLNDVTYRDWERYHKFMFRSRDVAEEFLKIFNGHTVPPVSNPVHEEIGRIEHQLHHVSLDFKAGIEKIRKQGWKYLFGDIDENASPTQEKEKEAEPPVFSILPIDVDEKVDNVIKGGEAIIGKSKEQVEQAVLMAEEAAIKEQKAKDAAVHHEEL